MAVASSTAAAGLQAAVVARDFARARSVLHDAIDFRAMTPNRIWEADGPSDVEDALRAWLDDPDEDIASVVPTEPEVVEDTVRVGWRVRGSDDDGEFVYEQQAYVRESAGQVTWLRVFCSGQRRPGSA